MRCIRKGKICRQFCALMNLPPPPCKFQKFNKMLLLTLFEIPEESMKRAVTETTAYNEINN